jgi:dienelactone hydrolase
MRLTRVVLALCLVLAGCSASPAAVGPSPSAPAVIVSSLELKLTTFLYEPTTPGKHPLVIFVHGWTGLPNDHERLFRAWAGAGFIVAAPAMARTARGARVLDIGDLINQPAAVSENLTEVLGKLGDKVDQEKIAAAGFSLGGMTIVGLFTKFRDPRLKAGIVMAGTDRSFGHEYTGPPAGMFFIHGRVDDTVPFADGMRAYEPVTWPKVLLDLPKGDHLSPYRGDGSAEYLLVESCTTDYLKWTLLADETAKGRLAAVAGVTITA